MFFVRPINLNRVYVHEDGTEFINKEDALLYCFYKWKQEVLAGSGSEIVSVVSPILSVGYRYEFKMFDKRVVFIPNIVVTYSYGEKYIEAINKRRVRMDIRLLFYYLIKAYPNIKEKLIAYDPYYLKVLFDNMYGIINYKKLITKREHEWVLVTM